MKLAAIVILRDEFDILELFFRINSRVIDHFFVVDTVLAKNFEVLDKLKEREGFDITVFRDLSGNLNENLIAKKALMSAKTMKNFDWVFFLDFDEFINIDREALEKELATIPKYQTAYLRHSTWVPKTGDFFKTRNMLWSNFNRRKEEFYNLGKVIVPYDLFDSVNLSPIFHIAYFNHVDDMIKVTQLQCGGLDHVPVRSANQILVKIMMGKYKLALKKNRLEFEKPYWDAIAKLLYDYNFKIDDVLLRYIALTYTNSDLTIDVESGVDLDSRLGLKTDSIQYGVHEHNPNIFFNVLIENYSNTIKKYL